MLRRPPRPTERALDKLQAGLLTRRCDLVNAASPHLLTFPICKMRVYMREDFYDSNPILIVDDSFFRVHLEYQIGICRLTD